MQKDIYITIKYKEGKYQSNNTTYNIILNFDFKSVHQVTYTDFTTTTSSYPQYVMDEEDYNYAFTDSAPKKVKVTMGNLEKEYTYENNQLIIKNVTDDLYYSI